MDLKFKIVAMLFVLVAIGYAIYFIMNDFSKQKSIEKVDRRITETYEDYDLRKQILNQLDTHKIDKKVKTTIYDSMSANMEKFKDMPEDKMNDFIKDIINKTKEAIKPPSEKDEEKKNEKFEAPKESDEDKDDKDDKEDKEEFEQHSLTGANDINNMIETTVTQIGGLEKNLSQIKSMVNAMAMNCNAPAVATTATSKKAKAEPTEDADKPTKKAPSSSTSTSASIEGFENFVGKSYSFI